MDKNKNMKSITWATKNRKFFRGDEDRPVTELEKACVYMLAGATLLIVAVRLYQVINLRIALWF